MEYKITSDNFETEVLRSDIPVLLDFWAPWCGPCRMIAPSVAAIAEKYNGKVKVGKVNVDEEPELANAFGVESIPTLVYIREGKIVGTKVGYQTLEELEAIL